MSFDNLILEKGMYSHPTKSFSEILEELDPSANYQGTEYEGLDAFGRQLKRFNIKVAGAGSDQISKFFATTQSAALFPEYVSRAVKQGVTEADMLPSIVATTTRINSLDYRSIASVPTDEDMALEEVAEGAAIPETEVKIQENLVDLKKRGRMLVASYEALKFQKIDLFSVTLKQIGAHIARQQFADAVDVLLNGDGNDNAASVISVATSGTLKYTDLLSLYNKLDPYTLNRFIVSPATMLKLMNLEEFKNPLTGINFQGTGNPGNPLGAKVLRSSSVADDKIIGLDANCALEMVIASDISVDYDKLIDRQLERAVITTTAGFAKIFGEASAVLKV
ncbi:MAG: phage major capsid protein [Ruminococcaceae bacterium]|nr:phage major capsid protein [Oscillospiraceae bacterium]